MAILSESPARVLDELSLGDFDGTPGLLHKDRFGFGHDAYRCPQCGNLEYTDSAIAGTCPLCPGVVKLVAV